MLTATAMGWDGASHAHTHLQGGEAKYTPTKFAKVGDYGSKCESWAAA